MKITRKIIILVVMLFISNAAYSQNEKSFCKAVEKKNFNKIERLVHQMVRKNRKGVEYFNGEGSGYQINLSYSLDTITASLKKNACVADAYWDKCQQKIAIYPGHSTIGVQFKTDQGIIEKCFIIQEGTTGQLNIFRWKFKIFKSKNKLVYQKMINCENFIQQQKEKCKN